MISAAAKAQEVPAQARELFRKLLVDAGAGKRISLETIGRLQRAYPRWFPPLQLLVQEALNDGNSAVVDACVGQASGIWGVESPQYCWLRAMIHKDRGELGEGMNAVLEGLGMPSRDVGLTRWLLMVAKEIGGRDAVCTAPLPPGLEKVSSPGLEFLADGLEHLGDLSRAEAIRQAMAGNGPVLDALATRKGDDADWLSDLVSIEAPGSDVAVVVFTGLMHETGVRVEVLKRELTTLPFHFVALRDINRLTFLGGHRALGGDPGTAAASLRSHLDAMGVRKIIVVGNSAGCVGALMYGALMQADAIVCYGPISSMVAPFEYRGRAVKRRIENLVPPEWLRPPVERLESCGKQIPIQVNYGDDMQVDCRHAMEIATLPLAQMAPLEGFDGHDVVRELIARGELRSRFEGFVGPVLAAS